jgi:hypothetical protein
MQRSLCCHRGAGRKLVETRPTPSSPDGACGGSHCYAWVSCACRLSVGPGRSKIITLTRDVLDRNRRRARKADRCQRVLTLEAEGACRPPCTAVDSEHAFPRRRPPTDRPPEPRPVLRLVGASGHRTRHEPLHGRSLSVRAPRASTRTPHVSPRRWLTKAKEPLSIYRGHTHGLPQPAAG